MIIASTRPNAYGERGERLQFINALAHELKTPLISIVALGGLLLEELKQDEQSPLVRVIENMTLATKTLEARLTKLLDMAKMKSLFLLGLMAFSLIGVIPQDTLADANGSQYGTLYLDKGGSLGSSGHATWFTPGAKFDTYVVILNGGREAGVSYGRVWKRVNIPLATITDISFWYHHVSTDQADYSSWPLYKQEGHTYTDDDGYVSPYVTLEISDGSTTRLIISQPFARDPDGTWMPAWEQWQMTDNAAAAGGEDPTEALWHDELFSDDPDTGGSGAYPAGWEYLSYFQSEYSGYNVVRLMITVGEWDWDTKQVAYVDDITVDNMTYAIEPRVFIGSTPYGAIDTAIAAAVDDQTINVYPGTFSPEGGLPP